MTRTSLIFVLIASLFFTVTLSGADPEKREQELLKQLNTGKLNDEEMSKTLYRLGLVCIDYKPADARMYAGRLYDRAGVRDKLHADIIMGSLTFNTAGYDSAAVFLNKALKNYETNFAGDAIGSDIYNKYAHLSIINGEPKKALEYYIKALDLDEQRADYESMCAICTNISQLYGQIGADSTKQLQYARMALEYGEESGDDYSREMAYSTYGNLLQGIGREKEGLAYLQKSLELCRRLKSDHKTCFALLNIGCIYYETGVYDKAETHLKEALDIAIRIGMKRPESYIYLVLSDVYRDSGRLVPAEEYIHKSLDTREALTGMEQSDVLAGAMRLYAAKGDLGSFNIWFDEYETLIQTSNDQAIQRELLDMEAKYENEKKSLKITTLEQEKRQTLLLATLAVILLLSISVTLFFVNRYTRGKKLLAEQKVKRLEQEQQLVATQAVLEGESAERSRLAKDLHDGLGGMLAAVKVNMQNVRSMEASDDAKYFGLAVEILDNSIKELRRVAHHLMPESLMLYGLKASLSVFCQAIPNVRFHHYGTETRLNSNLETLIYRSAHELVYNALKHSEATQINVQLVQEHDRVSLLVQDNGRGFDPSEETMGMGLKNIKQRVVTFNGDLNIFSTPGSGTEISLEFELNHQSNDTGNDNR